VSKAPQDAKMEFAESTAHISMVALKIDLWPVQTDTVPEMKPSVLVSPVVLLIDHSDVSQMSVLLTELLARPQCVFITLKMSFCTSHHS
jgi:hypothetical protein